MKINARPAEFNYKTIKTFEDACIKTNVDIPCLQDVSKISDRFKKHIISAYKLMIIYEAINNHWVPDWNNKKQYKYYPTFVIAMRPSYKIILRSYFRYTCTFIGESEPYLCTDSWEKALYIANQFKNIYEEYLF
jgi:hypothetical protein